MAASSDLTIRLTPEERSSIELAAGAQHLPVSTWLRQLALKAVTAERDEAEQRARRKEWWAKMREELWSLPADNAHADEVERARREWSKKARRSCSA
ncbi:MAG: hypothetical protein WCC48_11235 [Anaeromyxobacteraceae bacterium]